MQKFSFVLFDHFNFKFAFIQNACMRLLHFSNVTKNGPRKCYLLGRHAFCRVFWHGWNDHNKIHIASKLHFVSWLVVCILLFRRQLLKRQRNVLFSIKLSPHYLRYAAYLLIKTACMFSQGSHP